jgi:hypothetical protein
MTIWSVLFFSTTDFILQEPTATHEKNQVSHFGIRYQHDTVKELNVTKKILDTMMGRLVPLGIVDMINDQYELTRQGKEIF